MFWRRAPKRGSAIRKPPREMLWGGRWRNVAIVNSPMEHPMS
jgi:hypothetical protein